MTSNHTPPLWKLILDITDNRYSEIADTISVNTQTKVTISGLELEITADWEQFEIKNQIMGVKTKLLVKTIKGTLEYHHEEHTRYQGSEKLMKMMDCDTLVKSPKVKLSLSHLKEYTIARYIDLKDEVLNVDDELSRSNVEKSNHFYCRLLFNFPTSFETDYINAPDDNRTGKQEEDFIISFCFAYDPEKSDHKGNITYDGKFTAKRPVQKLKKGVTGYSDPWNDEIKGTRAKREIDYELECYAKTLELQELQDDLVNSAIGRANGFKFQTGFENSYTMEIAQIASDPNASAWFIHKNIQIKVPMKNNPNAHKLFISVRQMAKVLYEIDDRNKLKKTIDIKKFHNDNVSGAGSWYDLPGSILLGDPKSWPAWRDIIEFTYSVKGFPEFGVLYYRIIIDTKPHMVRIALIGTENISFKEAKERWKKGYLKCPDALQGFNAKAPFTDLRTFNIPAVP